MLLVWIGLLLIAGKYFEVGPLAGLSWWYILAPLGLAFLWFEAFERIFGFDRRKLEHDEFERRRKERVAKTFGLDKKPGRR